MRPSSDRKQIMPTMPEITHPTDSRWIDENVDVLRRLASVEASQHDLALSAGGYQSGRDDVVADVELTHPVEVTHETIAILFNCAADFIEVHLRTGIELEHAPGWARLVNRALDLAGIHAPAS